MAGVPFRDGSGPLPDSRAEIIADLLIVFVVASLLVFTGLDAQIESAVEDSSTYFSLSSDVPEDAVVFDREAVDLMNKVSERSLGVDAVASERLYCGEISNQRVTDFRLADTIRDSSLTSVSGSCIRPVDIFVHSQPDGSSGLSEEDRSLESEVISYTCVQYSQIVSSPLNNRLTGINCWMVVGGGESFEQVPVFLG